MNSDNEEFSAKDQYGVKKRVSIVWKYFEKLSRLRVRCKLCGHEQNYQGTTGNILRHLKNKHNIDATLKGQAEGKADYPIGESPDGTYAEEKVKDDEEEFDVIVKTELNDVNILTVPRRSREARSKVISYSEEPDLDPYADETAVEFADYLDSNEFENSKRKMHKPQSISTEVQRKPGIKNETPASAQHIAEERILAEIEYFREKAAFYRMQKNLVALQAKKVKYELDQLG